MSRAYQNTLNTINKKKKQGELNGWEKKNAHNKPQNMKNSSVSIIFNKN